MSRRALRAFQPWIDDALQGIQQALLQRLAIVGIGDHALQVFLLALIPGLIGMLIYYRGLQETRASYATIAELAYPATALIVNWIFLDATLTVGQLVGFILLWAAITAMSRLPAQKPARLDVQAAA